MLILEKFNCKLARPNLYLKDVEVLLLHDPLHKKAVSINSSVLKTFMPTLS